MTPVILLSGKARSGKDTAGAVLAAKLHGQCIAFADPMKRFCMQALGMTEEQLWGAEKEIEFELRLSQPTGNLGMNLVNVLSDSEVDYSYSGLATALVRWRERMPAVTTPRYILQTLGTEMGRAHDPDLWVDYGLSITEKLLVGCSRYNRKLGLVDSKDAPPDVVCITDGRFRNEVLKAKQMGAWCIRIVRPEAGLTGAPSSHASETEQGSIPDWWFDTNIENRGTLEEFCDRVELLGPHYRYAAGAPVVPF